jgi:hypothetical protein
MKSLGTFCTGLGVPAGANFTTAQSNNNKFNPLGIGTGTSVLICSAYG